LEGGRGAGIIVHRNESCWIARGEPTCLYGGDQYEGKRDSSGMRVTIAPTEGTFCFSSLGGKLEEETK